MKISILTDNDKSWFIPFGYRLQERLKKEGCSVRYVFNKNDIEDGDICFLLSCSRIIEKDYLSRNEHNIVIHASDLPRGKGFSPLQWQILEGKNDITLTLFEVVEKVDAGPYYIKDNIKFHGHELYAELRDVLGNKIIEMAVRYSKRKDQLKPIEQNGEESFYRRRTSRDDVLDINKTIYEHFNHFRIADNENYPLFFTIDGHKYILKIYKALDINQ